MLNDTSDTVPRLIEKKLKKIIIEDTKSSPSTFKLYIDYILNNIIDYIKINYIIFIIIIVIIILLYIRYNEVKSRKNKFDYSFKKHILENLNKYIIN